MEMLQVETVIGAVLGGGLTTVVARHFILKALRDLEKIFETVQGISAKLSVIEVRLGQLEKVEQTAASHDRQITEIQSRLKYERPIAVPRTDKARLLET